MVNVPDLNIFLVNMYSVRRNLGMLFHDLCCLLELPLGIGDCYYIFLTMLMVVLMFRRLAVVQGHCSYYCGIWTFCLQVGSIKVIRNKQTNQSEGYGFIEFTSRAGAERVLQTFNGTIMPNGGQNFRLNWATFSSGERRHDDSPDYTIFVGDLATDVTDYHLTEVFRTRYSSVKGAKVVIDRLTGRTKGYGFVRFADEGEQMRAMTEMQGVLCSTRPMRIGPASNKNLNTQSSKGLSLP